MKRANNTGSICFEKSTKKFRAAVSVNGKRIVKRFATEEEAKRWITITIADVYQGKFKDPSQTTFQEFAEKYMELYATELRPTSYSIYCHWLSKLKPIFKIKLQNLTAMDMQRCINNIDACTNTKNQVRNLAKRILKKALDMDMVNKNVAESVKVSKPKKHSIVKPTEHEEIFTRDEIDKILATAKTMSVSRNHYLFLLTTILTGMRMAEVIGLQYQDIKANAIEVNSGVTQLYGHALETLPKTDAGARLIPVPQKLCEMLRNNNSEGMLPTDYVFHTRKRTPWNPTNVEQMWKELLIRAGIPHRNFHNLRHYHASMLIDNKVSFLDISKRLGHANPAITVRIYSHSTPGYEKRIVDKVMETFPLLEQ